MCVCVCVCLHFYSINTDPARSSGPRGDPGERYGFGSAVRNQWKSIQSPNKDTCTNLCVCVHAYTCRCVTKHMDVHFCVPGMFVLHKWYF